MMHKRWKYIAGSWEFYYSDKLRCNLASQSIQFSARKIVQGFLSRTRKNRVSGATSAVVVERTESNSDQFQSCRVLQRMAMRTQTQTLLAKTCKYCPLSWKDPSREIHRAHCIIHRAQSMFRYQVNWRLSRRRAGIWGGESKGQKQTSRIKSLWLINAWWKIVLLVKVRKSKVTEQQPHLVQWEWKKGGWTLSWEKFNEAVWMKTIGPAATNVVMNVDGGVV